MLLAEMKILWRAYRDITSIFWNQAEVEFNTHIPKNSNSSKLLPSFVLFFVHQDVAIVDYIIFLSPNFTNSA